MLIYFNVKFVQYQQIVYMSIPHFHFFIRVNIEFLSIYCLLQYLHLDVFPKSRAL